MNAISLINRVARRVPSYSEYEYLDEINTAYKECWDYILQLDDSYFTDVKTVTVTTQAAEFDFLYNSNGFLSSAVSPRYFQVDRIRIRQATDNNWFSAIPSGWNDPAYLGQQQIYPQQASIAPAYRYQLFAKGSILWGQPLPAGTLIEVTYSFIWLPLTYLTNGTVTTSSATVTGTGTNFTQILGMDFQQGLPGNDQDTDVGVEFIFNNNQTYRVKTISSDTAATTVNTIAPAQTAAGYSLAMVPDIPEGHHNVIATLATRNFMSTPASDSRLAFWASLAEKELDSMRDSIMTRQRQLPARRQRFPQSILRYQIVSPGN
jgi:hypothetical protein